MHDKITSSPCMIKEQSNKEFNKDWNEAFNIAKDEKVWKTLGRLTQTLMF